MAILKTIRFGAEGAASLVPTYKLERHSDGSIRLIAEINLNVTDSAATAKSFTVSATTTSFFKLGLKPGDKITVAESETTAVNGTYTVASVDKNTSDIVIGVNETVAASDIDDAVLSWETTMATLRERSDTTMFNCLAAALGANDYFVGYTPE